MLILKKLKQYGFIVLLLTCLISCEQEPELLFDVAISNVNLIDLETGQIHKKDIYLKDGRFALIESSMENSDTRAKQNIDGSDKYALPGFWDNHVHFRGGDSLIAANKSFLNLFIANGITTVRDAGGDLTSSVMDWKTAIENNEMIGPTIFTSGPKIDGPGATWAGSLEVENDAEIKYALDSLQSIPTDFVKLYDSRISGDNYIKTIQEAERRNLITSGHMPFTVELNTTIDAGMDAIEHLYYIMKGCSSQEKEITKKLINGEIGFWNAMPLLQATYTDETAQKTFTQLKQNNVFVVPTLHIGHTLSYLDEVDHSKDLYLKFMSAGIQKTYQGRIASFKNASEKAVEDRKALDRFFGSLAYSLNESGVSLLAGSDSGAYNSYTYPGISLHNELQAMVATGISPLDALRTSAYNGAKFLKKESDYGTVTTGKIADIVLLNNNPLEEIKSTQDIFMVFKKGMAYTDVALKEMLKPYANEAE